MSTETLNTSTSTTKNNTSNDDNGLSGNKLDRRLTKNEKRRLKKKQEDTTNKNNAPKEKQVIVNDKEESDDANIIKGVKIEYVSADIDKEIQSAGLDESLLDEFKLIFKRFVRPEELMQSGNSDGGLNDIGAGQTKNDGEDQSQKVSLGISRDSFLDGDANGPVKLSKKKKKLMSRLSVAELKQLVQRPDVVEAHDVTSLDPRFLVYLKAYRNTVPVPRHWCLKRKYLQGKRGLEKSAFKLPDFIADTGIAKIRDSLLEQEALQKSKQKARGKLQPKMGKIDIDYQVLHDAFFKFQTRPKLTGHGDLYYEGKEFEVHAKERKPGQPLSDELKQALGMVDGNPPPWLINMQRYGPPPSYPTLKIPGLNAPLPPGAVFGYQAGGWGKPPVDEYGRPLYGDVFGVIEGGAQMEGNVDVVDKSFRWGQMAAVEEVEDEEDEEEEEGDQEGAIGRGLRDDDQYTSGLLTPSTLDGTASVASGIDAPEFIDLRKRSAGLETPDTHGAPRELYQVLETKAAHVSAGQLFGVDKTYVLPGSNAGGNVSEDVDTDNQGDQSVTTDGGKRKRVDGNSTTSKRVKDFKF